jgi:hypothetical protein
MARRARRSSAPPRSFRPRKDGDEVSWASINPYIDWALGPGKSHYFRQEPANRFTPLLLRLGGKTAPQFLKEVFGHDKEPDDFRGGFFFRILCRTRSDPRGDFTVWLSAVANARIRDRIRSRASAFLESASLGRLVSLPALRALGALPKPPKPPAPPKPLAKAARARRAVVAAAVPRMVVIGIIDDGIAFAHERFRAQAGGTRVEYCWLQDGPVFFLTKAQIDALLIAYPDEEVLYRVVGQYNFHSSRHKSAAWRAAHGTHVMDLACGCDPVDDQGDRPIVCVQLPVATTADEDPGDLYYWISHAIDYIVDRARVIAAARGADPMVVINLSYGLLADPHDGTGDMEKFIDDKIAQVWDDLRVKLRVVLPSGNSYLSRIHAQLSFAAGPPTRNLQWRVQPDDRTPSFLEIWLPSPCPGPLNSRITLTVTSPTGASMTTFENGPPVTIAMAGVDYAWAYWIPWPLSDRARFIVIVEATAQPDTPVPQLAPAGRWQVDLTYTGGLAAADLIHAWVRRDDHVYGFPLRGRQSYLDDPLYERFGYTGRFDHAGRDEEFDNAASLARRESTINSMATGRSAIVLGGYLGKEMRLAKYSAAGRKPPPMQPPDLPPRWPDAVAVSEDSQVHTGVLAAGSHSGSVIAMGGTSVAAPQVARRVADDLAGGGNGDRPWVQGLAAALPPQYERSGAGTIPPVPIVKLKRFE